MRIGILLCDEIDAPQRAVHGDYAQMFMSLLRRADPDAEFAAYNATRKQLPKQINECDCYLITGSRAGVYDKLAWIPPLKKIRRANSPPSRPAFGNLLRPSTHRRIAGRPRRKMARRLGRGNSAMENSASARMDASAPQKSAAAGESSRSSYQTAARRDSPRRQRILPQRNVFGRTAHSLPAGTSRIHPRFFADDSGSPQRIFGRIALSAGNLISFAEG